MEYVSRGRSEIFFVTADRTFSYESIERRPVASNASVIFLT